MPPSKTGAFSAAVQAEYRRGQAQGDIYVNKTEIRHGTIEQMSKEEVMKALNELKQTYAPLTHDAGAEDADNRKRARERLAEETDGHTGREAEDQETERASFWQSLKKAMRDNFPDWSATRLESEPPWVCRMS